MTHYRGKKTQQHSVKYEKNKKGSFILKSKCCLARILPLGLLRKSLPTLPMVHILIQFLIHFFRLHEQPTELISNVELITARVGFTKELGSGNLPIDVTTVINRSRWAHGLQK